MSLTQQVSPVSHLQSDTVRVMVVDDSAVIRGLISRWITEETGLEVVASHRNGENAVNDVLKSDPDVVVLDIEMPVMDGMAALPELLRSKPNLIVIMASTLTSRNAEISLKALQLGAKDYIPKPSGNHGITTSVEFRRDLMEKIRVLGGGRSRRTGFKSSPDTGTTTRQPASKVTELTPARRDFKLAAKNPGRPRILAIGSSTGGPNALRTLMPQIASHIGMIPVVITQHMPATFTAILADHIAKETKRTAREGVDGEVLRPGQIYVAPGGKHMLIKSAAAGPTIALDDGPQVNFCKPAVDPMFHSLVEVYGGGVLSVVLTGMGSDGAAGALEISQAGGNVVAQDEATSVVWGMPGATAAAGACMAVLPLDQIGSCVNGIIGGTGI